VAYTDGWSYSKGSSVAIGLLQPLLEMGDELLSLGIGIGEQQFSCTATFLHLRGTPCCCNACQG